MKTPGVIDKVRLETEALLTSYAQHPLLGEGLD